MEVNVSEPIFESLNLNPKSFVNEIFNISDDLVNDAFDIYLPQDASELLQIEGTDRGVSLVKDRVQFVLNRGLTAWENYCLQHCFSLPQGFTLPETNQSANDLFKELRSTSSEFRSKLEKFRNSRAEEMHQKQLHGIYKQNGNAYNMMHTDGLFNSKMEELQQLLKGIISVD
ncbi:hypothetical protein Leryth_022551 [Lithospermum erythrorhizon]|nr:hypothetical protein Leryth_022551 [Lithospermum erythrorhizon]